MRRGERAAWREVALAAEKVAESADFAEEYLTKVALRSAWAKLYGIPGVTNLPRSGAALARSLSGADGGDQ